MTRESVPRSLRFSKSPGSTERRIPHCKLVVLLSTGALILSLTGCAGLPNESDEPKARLVELHDESLDGTSGLPAFRLSGVAELEIEKLWLVRGEVSKASLVKIGEGEIPSAVEKERVELRAERDAADFLLVPLVLLESETTYTLVVLGGGKIAEFRVADVPLRLLGRVGSGPVNPGETIRYCGNERIPREATRLLGGATTSLTKVEGRLGEYCRAFTIPSDAPNGFFSPPLLAGDVRFAPEPLWVGERSEDECVASESPVHERGGIVEVATRPSFSVHIVKKAISGETVAEVASFAEAPGVARLGPFAPETDFVLESSELEGSCEKERSTNFRTGQASGYFLLTEVLADPIGPEPATEWIEIENIGNGAGATTGLVLEDSGGTTYLPSETIPSGGFGLVVGEEFVVNPESDAIPDPKAIRLGVEAVGVRGLSNSGEKLVLLDEKGEVLSSIPALAAETGKSWTRTGTTDERSSFSLADPTPGFR